MNSCLSFVLGQELPVLLPVDIVSEEAWPLQRQPVCRKYARL